MRPRVFARIGTPTVPILFGHLWLMTRDNIPATTRLALLIGRTRKEIGVKTPDVLSKPVVGPCPRELL